MDTEATYSQTIERLVLQFFCSYKVEDFEKSDFKQALINLIVHCFHLKAGRLSQETKACIILEHIFGTLSKDSSLFAKFLQCLTKRSERKQFLIALIYGLYYGDLDLSKLVFENPLESPKYLLFQFAAETVSSFSLRKILKSLSFQEQLALICYCYKNYREGSNYILRELEERKNSPFEMLISGLRRHYYSVEQLFHFLLENPIKDETAFKLLMKRLEKHALQKTEDIEQLFKQLIPIILDSPVKQLQELKTANVHVEKEAIQQKDLLTQRFQFLLAQPYPLEAFQTFTQIFGMEGHQPRIQFLGSISPENTLIENFSILKELFEQPFILTKAAPSELLGYLTYSLGLGRHLESLYYHPERYLEGINRISFAIPTKNKPLERQAALPSLIRNLKTLISVLNARLSKKMTLKKVPIFVYDQSEPSLFEKNARYIRMLNRRNKCSVLHVGNEETLLLAKKIGIEPLLNTSKNGQLGFGGMRNCVALLTPVLRQAFRMGSKIMEIAPKTLREIFFENTLEGKDRSAIFMCDDDMEIAEANLFSYALFLEETQHPYSFAHGFISGRGTRFSIRYLSLNDVLNSPQETYQHTQWLNQPFSASMTDCVMKPKICVNLPFGSEEKHFETLGEIIPLLQITYHLGGTRYPNKRIPTHYFVGLEEYLKSYLPYTLCIDMAQCLLDPMNQYQRSVFPWNAKEVWSSFTCLNDVFHYVSRESTITTMQKRFWDNMAQFFKGEQKSGTTFLESLQDLMYLDLKSIVRTFLKQNKLNASEKKSLKQIAEIYNHLQKDAKLFWEFGMLVTQRVRETSEIESTLVTVKNELETKYRLRFSDFPLTQGLYLLFLSIGAAQFNKFLKDTAASR